MPYEDKACYDSTLSTEWRGIIGCLIFTGHFPQKTHVILGSFAEKDLQLKAFYDFTPLCTDMGWLRIVGSIKWWVSFAEYSLFYRALLQKRPTLLSILLTEATQYKHSSCTYSATYSGNEFIYMWGITIWTRQVHLFADILGKRVPGGRTKDAVSCPPLPPPSSLSLSRSLSSRKVGVEKSLSHFLE